MKTSQSLVIASIFAASTAMAEQVVEMAGDLAFYDNSGADFDPPKDDCCVLYTEKQFKGEKMEVCHGGSEKSFDFQSHVIDENASSMICGKRARI